ncbi:MAG: hypothetical protein H6636_09925 [Anaerolineales bacterium]|nr:hypothetical protein [Anaerolineales bacterium]
MIKTPKKPHLQRKAEKKIREVLEENEKLIATLVGYPYHAPNLNDQDDQKLMSIEPSARAMFGITTYLYLGLTTQNLIILEENLLGLQIKFERVPIKKLKWAMYTPDKPTDKFSIYYENQHIDLMSLTKSPQRDATTIVEIVQKNGNAEGMPASSFHSSPHPVSSRSYIRNKAGNLSTKTLFLLLIFTGLSFGAISAKFFGIDSGRFGTPLSYMMFAITLILFGSPGYLTAKRKELPYGFITLRGNVALVSGLGCATFWWGLALWVLISIFQ